MKGYIEERAVELAQYIIDKRTTVRAAAKKFGISKSTVHKVDAKWNGISVTLLELKKYLEAVSNRIISRSRNPISVGGEAQ